MPDSASGLTGVSILVAFGHPDDEGFGCGGTLAMLAAQGARITLVCGTNGDVGEISDPSLATPQNLAEVRQEEMRCAAAVTGITDLRFLGYRDSGMPGSKDNDHPNSLYQAEPGKVVGQGCGYYAGNATRGSYYSRSVRRLRAPRPCDLTPPRNPSLFLGRESRLLGNIG